MPPVDPPVSEDPNEASSSSSEVTSSDMVRAWLAGPDDEKVKAVPSEWRVADVILDTFEVRKVIRTGAMGTVYRVWHSDWELDLAVKSTKRPARKPGESEEEHEENWQLAVGDFFAECGQWIRLGMYPHIASCFHVQVMGQGPTCIPRAFVEWVDGGSLKEWIGNGRLYSGGHKAALARILDIAIQAAWGLYHVHELSMTHQDVKPGNVLIPADYLENPEAVVKVTDFGMVREGGIRPLVPGMDSNAPSDATMVTISGGHTMPYRSPEQAKGKLVTRRSDVWSLALTVLAMFRGKPTLGDVPWALGEDAREHLAWLRTGEEIDSHVPRLPESLAKLLAQCFNENSDERPHDMLVLAENLTCLYTEETGQSYLRERPTKVEGIADALNNWGVSALEFAKFRLGPKKDAGLVQQHGDVAGAVQEVDRALNRFEEALKADPLNLEARYNRGLIRWRRAGTTDDALVRELEDTWQARADDWRSGWLLAQLHLERGDYDHVLSAIDQQHANPQPPARALEDCCRLSERLRRHPLQATTREYSGMRVVGRLSADGDTILAWQSSGESIDVWDKAFRGPVRSHGITEAVISAVSLSASGQLAVWNDDSNIYVWDLREWKSIGTLRGHDKTVETVSLSADGRIAVSGGSDKTVRIWNTETCTCQWALEGHDRPIVSVAINANGTTVVSLDEGSTVFVWDVTTGRCKRELDNELWLLSNVSISADGRYAVAGGGGGAASLWDTSTGRRIRTINTGIELVQKKIISVSMTPDAQLAVTGTAEGVIQVWELSSGRCLRTLRTHGKRVTSLEISADGLHLLAGIRFSGVTLYDLAPLGERAPLFLCKPTNARETAKAARSHAEYLRRGNHAYAHRQWGDAAAAASEARAQVAFQRSNATILFTTLLGCRLPRTEVHEVIQRTPLNVHDSATETIPFETATAMSPDGAIAMVGNAFGMIELWNTETGQVAAALSAKESPGDAVTALTFDKSGRIGVSGHHNGIIRIWDVKSEQCLMALRGHEQAIAHVFIVSDGVVLSASIDNSIRVWDSKMGRCLRVLNDAFGDDVKFRDPISGLSNVIVDRDDMKFIGPAMYTNGHVVLSGGADSSLVLWRLSDGKRIRVFGHVGCVQSACLSADGRLAMIASKGPKLKVRHDTPLEYVVGLIDVKTGKWLWWTEEPASRVALSSDGRVGLSWTPQSGIATTIWDMTAPRRLWRNTAKDRMVYDLCADGAHVFAVRLGRLERWILGWNFTCPDDADWDEGARSYLENFLALHTPSLSGLPAGREPTDEEVTRYLTRCGPPVWTEQQFQDELICTLDRTGFGWLRPEGVQAKLEEMRNEQIESGGVPAAFCREWLSESLNRVD